jgi:hypothetical protein
VGGSGVDVVLAVLITRDWLETNHSRGFRGVFREVLGVVSRNDPRDVTRVVRDVVRDVRSYVAVDA